MENVSKVINEMNYEEIHELKNQINQGVLQRIIDERITQLQDNIQKVCPVCNNDMAGNSGFTLFFGPQDLRMSATFCAQDCLFYFLNTYRQEKQREE